ncbi:MAG: hypothetical protein AAF658_18020, partial [Myxococcota bacterium]
AEAELEDAARDFALGSLAARFAEYTSDERSMLANESAEPLLERLAAWDPQARALALQAGVSPAALQAALDNIGNDPEAAAFAAEEAIQSAVMRMHVFAELSTRPRQMPEHAIEGLPMAFATDLVATLDETAIAGMAPEQAVALELDARGDNRNFVRAATIAGVAPDALLAVSEQLLDQNLPASRWLASHRVADDTTSPIRIAEYAGALLEVRGSDDPATQRVIGRIAERLSHEPLVAQTIGQFVYTVSQHPQYEDALAEIIAAGDFRNHAVFGDDVQRQVENYLRANDRSVNDLPPRLRALLIR